MNTSHSGNASVHAELVSVSQATTFSHGELVAVCVPDSIPISTHLILGSRCIKPGSLQYKSVPLLLLSHGGTANKGHFLLFGDKNSFYDFVTISGKQVRHDVNGRLLLLTGEPGKNKFQDEKEQNGL